MTYGWDSLACVSFCTSSPSQECRSSASSFATSQNQNTKSPAEPSAMPRVIRLSTIVLNSTRGRRSTIRATPYTVHPITLHNVIVNTEGPFAGRPSLRKTECENLRFYSHTCRGGLVSQVDLLISTSTPGTLAEPPVMSACPLQRPWTPREADALGLRAVAPIRIRWSPFYEQCRTAATFCLVFSTSAKNVPPLFRHTANQPDHFPHPDNSWRRRFLPCQQQVTNYKACSENPYF